MRGGGRRTISTADFLRDNPHCEDDFKEDLWAAMKKAIEIGPGHGRYKLIGTRVPARGVRTQDWWFAFGAYQKYGVAEVCWGNKLEMRFTLWRNDEYAPHMPYYRLHLVGLARHYVNEMAESRNV